MVKRRFRLTRSTDFQRVRRLGRSYAHPLLVLITYPNEQGGCRIGIAAGKAVGGAVQRNRAKRLIRASVQTLLLNVKPGWDVVILARKPMIDANFSGTQDALATLFRRAHLV